MSDMKTIKVKYLKGAIGDMQAEWMTAEDWERHAKYVEELKAKGEYLKEEEAEITYKPHPVFDAPDIIKTAPLMSCSLVILDFSKDGPMI